MTFSDILLPETVRLIQQSDRELLAANSSSLQFVRAGTTLVTEMEMHLKSLSFRHDSKPQILPLTGMRIVLAMWVVVFHQIPSDCLLGQYMGSLPRPLFSLAATGYVAVGVFFVLSGFILALNYSLTGK
jgi:hypothetical protein